MKAEQQEAINRAKLSPPMTSAIQEGILGRA